MASWSRDGKRIYFGSNRTGKWQLWAVPAAGGSAVQITKNGGYLAFESWDGKSLYYTMSNIGVNGLFRVPIQGGEEAKIVNEVLGGHFAAAASGVYFIPPPDVNGRSSIQVYEFSTGRTKSVAAIENPSGLSSLSVSPDGRSFIYTRAEQNESDLMLVENFR